MSHAPELVGASFQGKGAYGDFEWMVHQDEYKNALFVFNDSERCMHTCERGGGNACVRPFNRYGYERNGFGFVRSVGIPTGQSSRGYRNLEEGKVSIDYALSILKKTLREHEYDTVFFSEGKGGLIGCGIFDVPYEVRVYITRSLRNL